MVGRRGFVAGVVAGAAGAAVASTWRDLPAIAELEGVEHSLDGHRIEKAALHLGAVVLRMRAPDGQMYQVDVLRKGSQPGLRDSRDYSLFLANRGDGSTSTNETQGLGLIALVSWLDSANPKLPELLTFEERRAAHPGGLFLLT